MFHKSSFSFDIQHHTEGKLHCNADPLSRYPEILKDKAIYNEQDLYISPENAKPLLAGSSQCSPSGVSILTSRDSDFKIIDNDVLGPVVVAVETKQKPNISQQKSRTYSNGIDCTFRMVYSFRTTRTRKEIISDSTASIPIAKVFKKIRGG